MLRALQEREIERVGSTEVRKIDVRIVAATNRDLRKEVAEGRFRMDLFYRIAVATINIPPLRERVEDIQLIADFLLDKLSQQHAVFRPVLDPEALLDRFEDLGAVAARLIR